MNKFVSTSDGRKDLGKYWGEMMKDQPMPEAIQKLGPFISGEVKKYGPTGERLFVGDFNLRPDVTIYHDDVNPNEVKSTKKDCNSNHDGPKSEDKSPYVDDFEPNPIFLSTMIKPMF